MAINLKTPLAETWKRRLDRWRQSGLSATRFAKLEKVSEPRLYTWRKRFADAGPAPVTAPIFVPVKIAPALVPAPIELVLKSGHVLRLSEDISAARLGEIV